MSEDVKVPITIELTFEEALALSCAVHPDAFAVIPDAVEQKLNQMVQDTVKPLVDKCRKELLEIDIGKISVSMQQRILIAYDTNADLFLQHKLPAPPEVVVKYVRSYIYSYLTEILPDCVDYYQRSKPTELQSQFEFMYREEPTLAKPQRQWKPKHSAAVLAKIEAIPVKTTESGPVSDNVIPPYKGKPKIVPDSKAKKPYKRKAK